MRLKNVSRFRILIAIVGCVVLLGLPALCVWLASEMTTTSDPYDIVWFTWPTASNAPEDLAHAEKLHQWVETNGGCELPCFLGITAGQTNWLLAHQSLKSFGLGYDENYQRGWLLDTTHNVKIEMDFTLSAAKIKSVDIRTFAEQMEADSYYAQMFQFYLLPSVLTRLRKPSQVWIGIDTLGSMRLNNIARGPVYTLALFYDSLGLMIRYEWKVEKAGKQWKLCPERGSMIALYVTSPQGSLSMDEIPLEPSSYSYFSLEQATGMTIDSFYETFKDVNPQVCLETPTKIWK